MEVLVRHVFMTRVAIVVTVVLVGAVLVFSAVQ